MLLRRITQHVKAQNWFAVVIDFVIVVIGVFIGIQVANWNDTRQERLSEAQYLDRFSNEIELTIAHIGAERKFSERSLRALENFTAVLYRNEAPDEELVAATASYLTDGAFFAKFAPNRTTFDDLITTGNFDIINDEQIRTDLIKLHASYEDAEETIRTNMDWVGQGEDRVYYGFDAFRFDSRTKTLFDETTTAELAEDVREHRELLRRHASFHYWIKVRSIELYDEIEPEAEALLQLIRVERGQ